MYKGFRDAKWGLTAEQRKSKPCELTQEILEPAKTITDPIQGGVYLSLLEVKFLDSPPATEAICFGQVRLTSSIR